MTGAASELTLTTVFAGRSGGPPETISSAAFFKEGLDLDRLAVRSRKLNAGIASEIRAKNLSHDGFTSGLEIAVPGPGVLA
ncbi:MAG: hypothetical protein DME23_17890 [Verrucomicrobia bacterium]|nr:MAG: hypothetical protein DME23_17890 [Verrucomicrobiota bacterium]